MKIYVSKTLCALLFFAVPFSGLAHKINDIGYNRAGFAPKITKGVETITKELDKKFPAAFFPEAENLVVAILTKLVSSNSYSNFAKGTPKISVRVVYDPMVNAMAAGDGRIYVFAGIIDVLRSDDELAAVLAHELTHVTRAHQERLVEWLDQRGVDITGQGGGAGGPIDLGKLGEIMFKFPAFKRAMESEADEAGLEILMASGYEMASMARAFTSLLSYSEIEKAKKEAAKKNNPKQPNQDPFGDSPLGDILKKIFESHPPLADRIGKVYAEAHLHGYDMRDSGSQPSAQYVKAREEVRKYFNAQEKVINPNPFPAIPILPVRPWKKTSPLAFNSAL